MKLHTRIPEVLGLVATLILAGCGTLDVSNPNAPDSKRALADPGTIQAIAQGAMRGWYNTTQNMDPDGPLSVMSDSHVASWNNFQIRIYTGCTTSPVDTCGTTAGTYPRIEWQNNPAAAARIQIESYWYGYYSALSSANDVLKAIRLNAVVITDAATTKMIETVAVLEQALALSGIALNYDKGFIVTYTTDLNALQFSARKAVRDSALARFDEAIALAGANSFTVPAAFFGSPGTSYSNVQIAQIANTMAARLLAYYPRNAAETGSEVNWATVATYASKGISSGTKFDWKFVGDGCVTWCDYLKLWSADMTTMRVHTRVARLLDPGSQETPFPISNPLTTLTAAITAGPAAATPDSQIARFRVGSSVTLDPSSVASITLTNNGAGYTSVPTVSIVGGHGTGTVAHAVVSGGAVTSVVIDKGGYEYTEAPSVSFSGGKPTTSAAGTAVLSVNPNQETVTVQSVTASTFSATFTKNHAAGALIVRSGGQQGNTQPRSPDLRLGDGTYGADPFARDVAETPPATASAGTDYAWSFDAAIFPTARGSWHQTNLGQIRYIDAGGIDPNGTGGGFGTNPLVLAAENDLLWAEGLIRSGGSLATAATLINNTRVLRGGLIPPAAAGDGVAGLLTELQYEQDVELPGSNVAPYYNRRRIDALEPLTPHEMPVPAKELGVLRQQLYTWGGASNPLNSNPSAPYAGATTVPNVQQIYAQMERQSLANARSGRHSHF